MKNKLTKLTRHQFHTVWTTAVDLPGYNKELFKLLEEKLKSENLFIPDGVTYASEQVDDCCHLS
jgi:hypothetical protein